MGLHFAVWAVGKEITTLGDSLARLRQHPALVAELAELFALLEDQSVHIPQPLDDQMGWSRRVPMAVHSRASLAEILAAFGRQRFDMPKTGFGRALTSIP